MTRVFSLIWGSTFLLGVAVIVIQGSPLKFPDQQSVTDNRNDKPVAPARGEGRFLNINAVPNGLFNRLTATNNLQDDIGDYDENVGGSNQQSGITSPPDVEDRRRHRQRKRPCVPYTPNLFRSNDNPGQGRTFLSLFYNDYNFFGGGGGGSPQYDTYGGYPCYSLGGQQTHRPHRPHRPNYPGTDPVGLGDGISNDTPSGNRPGGALGFFGPGGLFDVQAILTQWLRPQSGASGSGVLSEPTDNGGTTNNDVKPVVEINVQDTVQDVISTAGGLWGAVTGLFQQTPAAQAPLADPASAVQNDPPKDDLIQPRPSKRPHKHHLFHRSRSQIERSPSYPNYDAVSGVTQIAGGITNTVNGFAIQSATRPQTFRNYNRRRSSESGTSNNSNNYPIWSFYGLFN